MEAHDHHSSYDRYIPYNDLPDLPPQKELYSNDSVLSKLMEASRSLAELKGLAATLPNRALFVNTFSLREVKRTGNGIRPYQAEVVIKKRV